MIRMLQCGIRSYALFILLTVPIIPPKASHTDIHHAVHDTVCFPTNLSRIQRGDSLEVTNAF